MFLFQKRFHEGIVNGSITLTFRLWPKARVKPGGRYRVHPIGVVVVDSVSRCLLKDISPEDARGAGFDSLDDLRKYVGEKNSQGLNGNTSLFRVEFRHGGDGDYVPEALIDTLTAQEWAKLEGMLKKWDHPSSWTEKTLFLIHSSPRVAASKLAPSLGMETAPFKALVVKLKKLGLTQSFEVGYSLTPRGRAYFRRLKKRATASNSAFPTPSRPRSAGKSSRAL